MKKLLATAALAVASLGLAQQAQAQAGALLMGGVTLGKYLAKRAKMTPAEKAAEKAADEEAARKAAAEDAARTRDLGSPAVPTELHAQRTPTDKLPKKGGEQITALEAQLEQCRAAMQASPTAPVSTPAQVAAIQQAAVAVARANPSWSLQPYQQEMAFYAGENARRQAAAVAAPAPGN